MKPVTDLLTTGQMVKTLGVSDGKVKKAIKELRIAPKAKKGVCNYYTRDDMPRIKRFLETASR